MRFFFLLLLLLSSCSKQTTVGPKVLLIGIDGCRPDSLRDASTPNLDRLISTGAFNPEAQTCARTVSGPSWMSILTGTWPETHGVVDNSFDGYKAEHAQHFLSRIEKAKPELRTASITEWHPLAEKAQAGADFIAKANTTSEVADLAIEELANNPNAIFLHFDAVDHAGHSFGYGSEFPEYLTAIELVDFELGRILAEMENPEEWLILATTDHGGTGTGHGQDIPLHRTVFLLASGNYQAGPLRWRRYAEVVDIVPTILRHLRIPLLPEWNIAGTSLGMSAPSTPAPPKPNPLKAKAFTQTFDNSDVTFEMLPIANGQFWMSQTEISWDVFDLFFLRESDVIEADGVSGPSKSVFPVGRGFGHAGHPALGMTLNSAQHFCQWLSKKTGRTYRLATEDEWMLAAKGASNGWSAENADEKPHACGQLPAESNGLHDIIGNLAEWIDTGEDVGTVCGGSYLDENINVELRATYNINWQARDPQWPKSSWWMSDCGWVGIRVLCEAP